MLTLRVPTGGEGGGYAPGHTCQYPLLRHPLGMVSSNSIEVAAQVQGVDLGETSRQALALQDVSSLRIIGLPAETSQLTASAAYDVLFDKDDVQLAAGNASKRRRRHRMGPSVVRTGRHALRLILGTLLMLTAVAVSYRALWLVSPDPDVVCAQAHEMAVGMSNAGAAVERDLRASQAKLTHSMQQIKQTEDQMQAVATVSALFEPPADNQGLVPADPSPAQLKKGLLALNAALQSYARKERAATPAFESLEEFAKRFVQDVKDVPASDATRLHELAQAWWRVFGGVLSVRGKGVAALTHELQAARERLSGEKALLARHADIRLKLLQSVEDSVRELERSAEAHRGRAAHAPVTTLALDIIAPWEPVSVLVDDMGAEELEMLEWRMLSVASQWGFTPRKLWRFGKALASESGPLFLGLLQGRMVASLLRWLLVAVQVALLAVIDAVDQPSSVRRAYLRAMGGGARAAADAQPGEQEGERGRRHRGPSAWAAFARRSVLTVSNGWLLALDALAVLGLALHVAVPVARWGWVALKSYLGPTATYVLAGAVLATAVLTLVLTVALATVGGRRGKGSARARGSQGGKRGRRRGGVWMLPVSITARLLDILAPPPLDTAPVSALQSRHLSAKEALRCPECRVQQPTRERHARMVWRLHLAIMAAWLVVVVVENTLGTGAHVPLAGSSVGVAAMQRPAAGAQRLSHALSLVAPLRQQLAGANGL